jgi:hypothetical protein
MIIFTQLKLTWKLPVWVENPAILEESDEGETDDDDKTAANVVILSSLPFV